MYYKHFLPVCRWTYGIFHDAKVFKYVVKFINFLKTRMWNLLIFSCFFALSL